MMLPRTPPTWKEELKRSLIEMVDALPDDPPLPASEAQNPESAMPTLHEFYSALISLEANTRKNVQKTNASLDTVAKSLRALQRQIAQAEAHTETGASADPKPLLALDRQLHRLLDSLQTPPAPAPLGLSRRWQTAWADIAGGAEIILKSFSQILQTQGIRIQMPQSGDAFDPAHMEAAKVTAQADRQTTAQVCEVFEPAYFQGETLIRAARVHVRR